MSEIVPSCSNELQSRCAPDSTGCVSGSNTGSEWPPTCHWRNKAPACADIFQPNDGSECETQGLSDEGRDGVGGKGCTLFHTCTTYPFFGGNLREQVAEESNIRRAVKRIRKHPRKAGGIDRKTVKQVCKEVMEDLEAFCDSIRRGEYWPKPVLRVYIPKATNGKRPLGIPIVLDRIVQLAILQVLEPELDCRFSDSSYGFRPGRSVYGAAEALRGFLDSGLDHVVDFDLRNYFGSVNHHRLEGILSGMIEDEEAVHLIRLFLKAGVMEDGILTPSEEGVPQGGPMSPMLGNVYLHVCDTELEWRGHRFARYADDMAICVGSARAAQRVRRNVTKLLESMDLQVNLDKTTVNPPGKLAFLGFAFDGGSIRISDKAVERFKFRVQCLLERVPDPTMRNRVDKLRQYVNGWKAHYSKVRDKRQLRRLRGWYRTTIEEAMAGYNGGGVDSIAPALKFLDGIALPDPDDTQEPDLPIVDDDLVTDTSLPPVADEAGVETLSEGSDDSIAGTGGAL